MAKELKQPNMMAPTAKADKTAIEAKRFKKLIMRQVVLAVAALALVVILLFAMTSAWYTNVSRTEGLSFRTEAWGFDAAGNIVVPSDPVAAAPGMTGVVPVTVDNSSSDRGINVRVTVSRPNMNDELKKRVFFYADEARTVNGESVEKVYLGVDSYYAYRLSAGRKLILSDGYYNDIPIKWEWVYDVLGYYFRGTVASNAASAEEYLRPVEYDLDSASFDLENGGRLLSVGGGTVDALLNKVTSSDGYSGAVAASNAVTAGGKDYYPVSVDSNGYGVWLYLCSYSEIQAATDYDTALAAGTSLEATLTFSAANVPETVVEAASASELAAALDGDKGVIRLTGNISLDSTVTVAPTVEKTIDLAGFGITYTGAESEYSVFDLQPGAKLTVINGGVTGNGSVSTLSNVNSVIAKCAGAELTLSHVTVGGADCAVCINDFDSSNDSVVRIFESKLDAENRTVFVNGNGASPSALTKLIVEGSELTSRYTALSGSRAPGRQGSEAVLLNSTVTGNVAAVYHPQSDSKLLINNCAVTGGTAIAVKGGTVTVVDSTVTGTGLYTEAAVSESSFTDTGDAIYLEGGNAWSAAVIIQSGTFTSNHACGVRLFGSDGSVDRRIVVHGGTVNGASRSVGFDGNGSVTLFGGDFTSSVDPGVTRFDQ